MRRSRDRLQLKHPSKPHRLRLSFRTNLKRMELTKGFEPPTL